MSPICSISWAELTYFFNRNDQFISLTSKFCRMLVNLLTDILIGKGNFKQDNSLKLKCCQVLDDFLTRIGIFFYLKWSVLQINVQI